MKENIFKDKDIAISNLCLWDENSRFSKEYFRKTDQELIEHLLSKPKFKIEKFADAVIKDFDLPQLEKVVVYEHKNRLIVLEGNRRLTTYKLLIDPKLASTLEIRNYFESQKSKIIIDSDYTLECLVTKDREQGLRYIDRKHLHGNFEVGWGDTERAHHKARRGNANQKELLKVAITNIIRQLDLPDEIKEQVLGKGYVTTLWRMIEQSPAWDIFGYSLDKDGNLNIVDSDFKEKLKVIILDVLQKNKHNDKILSRLNNNELDDYLKSISPKDYKRADSEIKSHTTQNIFGQNHTDVTSSDNKRSNPKTTTRQYLIPKTCIFRIDEQKINNIFRELKHDLLLDGSKKSVPNAVGVMFRVFLEISIDFFLEKKGITLNPNTKLAGKITKIADYLETKKIANSNQLYNIRQVAIAKTSLLSIDRFHQYVHDYKAQPSSDNLIIKWDNLQEFFEILWNHLNKNNQKKVREYASSK